MRFQKFSRKDVYSDKLHDTFQISHTRISYISVRGGLSSPLIRMSVLSVISDMSFYFRLPYIRLLFQAVFRCLNRLGLYPV